MFFKYLFNFVTVPALLAMIALSGCLASPAGSATEAEPAIAEQAIAEAEMEAQIREAVFAWEDAYQTGDMDRLMEIYAEDAVSMPPNRPILEGKEVIAADFEQFFEEFTVDRQFSLLDIEIASDTAIRGGEWTQTFKPKTGGDSITEIGKCIVVFKRFDGEWKTTLEIWNLDE